LTIPGGKICGDNTTVIITTSTTPSGVSNKESKIQENLSVTGLCSVSTDDCYSIPPTYQPSPPQMEFSIPREKTDVEFTWNNDFQELKEKIRDLPARTPNDIRTELYSKLVFSPCF
jgi:hypothetical protein